MPSDKERYPGRFPVWMQLGYTKALKEPGIWHEVAEFWSATGADAETRKFRAFRRACKSAEFSGWEKLIREDAGEFQTRARVREEQVVVHNWPKTRRVVELMAFRGQPREKLSDMRAEGLRKLAESGQVGDILLDEGK